jgi:IS5 family transposase
MHNLSDELLCVRWVENSYFQFSCSELALCHRLPLDRSSLTHWRQRLGEEMLAGLMQESLAVAHKTGSLGPIHRQARSSPAEPFTASDT